MKRFISEDRGGYIPGFRFANRKSAALSTKVYRTRKGAEACCTYVETTCGENFGRNGTVGDHFPWTSLTEEGKEQVNFKRISCAQVHK